MNIEYFAPSYKRPIKSDTQKRYEFISLVVCESQADDYIKNGNRVVVCPDSAQGNLCRVRNWILNNLMKDNDGIVLIDDDIRFLGRFNNGTQEKLDCDEVKDFFENGIVMCRDWGFKYFGMNCLPDKGAYKEYMPFSTNKVVLGPLSCHLRESEIRYDENIFLKEDYDISLQHAHKYGGLLRFNAYHYSCKQSEQIGGCASSRNLEREKQHFYLLQKKWGSKIVQMDKSSKRGFDYNPRVHIPILGV